MLFEGSLKQRRLEQALSRIGADVVDLTTTIKVVQSLAADTEARLIKIQRNVESVYLALGEDTVEEQAGITL